jgi:DNA-binding response OmpR family regulator
MAYTALVVDDDEAARRICAYIVASMGFDVIEASDGEQALNVLMNHNPDLLLLDIRMPRVNGLQILRFVHKSSRFQNMTVIVLTAHSNIDILGVDGLLLKPAAPPVIEAAIRKHFPSLNGDPA